MRLLKPRAAFLRYDTLISQALRDIESDPQRLGVRVRAELDDSLHTYHLQFSSRRRPPDEQVRRPHRYFVYRIQDDVVETLRLIHDAQDLQRQLPVEEL